MRSAQAFRARLSLSQSELRVAGGHKRPTAASSAPYAFSRLRKLVDVVLHSCWSRTFCAMCALRGRELSPVSSPISPFPTTGSANSQRTRYPGCELPCRHSGCFCWPCSASASCTRPWRLSLSTAGKHLERSSMPPQASPRSAPSC